MCVGQQVAREVNVTEVGETVVVEERRVELGQSVFIDQSFLVASGEVAVTTREVYGCHVRVCRVCVIGRLGCEDGVRVVVGHTHRRIAEVGRCTVDAVDRRSCCRQTIVVLVDMCRHVLMWT